MATSRKKPLHSFLPWDKTYSRVRLMSFWSTVKVPTNGTFTMCCLPLLIAFDVMVTFIVFVLAFARPLAGFRPLPGLISGELKFVLKYLLNLLSASPVFKSFDYVFILKRDIGINVSDCTKGGKVWFRHGVLFVCLFVCFVAAVCLRQGEIITLPQIVYIFFV